MKECRALRANSHSDWELHPFCHYIIYITGLYILKYTLSHSPFSSANSKCKYSCVSMLCLPVSVTVRINRRYLLLEWCITRKRVDRQCYSQSSRVVFTPAVQSSSCQLKLGDALISGPGIVKYPLTAPPANRLKKTNNTSISYCILRLIKSKAVICQYQHFELWISFSYQFEGSTS